jgi:hypothetical protein
MVKPVAPQVLRGLDPLLLHRKQTPDVKQLEGTWDCERNAATVFIHLKTKMPKK